MRDLRAYPAFKLAAALQLVLNRIEEVTPPNQCLYGEPGEDCLSHCDCRWGSLYGPFLKDDIIKELSK